MKTSVPLWMFFGALGADEVSNICKKLFPETLGRVMALHWGCAVAGAILCSIGLFLSLRGLFSKQKNRRWFIFPCVLNLSFLTATLAMYFFAYVLIDKVYHMSNELPGTLPKLVDKAQAGSTEAKRVKAAQAIYELYGVKIAYLNDAGSFTVYEPSELDIAFYNQQKQSHEDILRSKETLKGALDQEPYLFSFFLGIFFLTFIFGSLWVLVRKSELEEIILP